jgi:eukaryotic-like serine/threonine-protein kinase
MIGRTIGNYTLVEKLGQGGMGEVYLAEHRRIGRRAAIKFLLPALSQDADVVTRFFNEARAASVIKHPGIVEIYDCDVVDEQAYIVMEYLEGESLAATLRRTGALAGEPIAIAAVIGQIASALAAAHRKEIIHRDLKPENVFLSVEESAGVPFVVKILDFGIAKLTAPGGGGSNTRTGGLLGTPVYMSPEQCRGLSAIDHRADIYALGCVMFEMATGRHVFVKEAAGDLLVAHVIETAPRISAFRPEIPGWMDDLAARMLAKGPDDRPSSMDEIVSGMASFLRVGAAGFGTRIPATSALGQIPTPRKRTTGPVAFSQTAAPSGASATPPRSVARSQDQRAAPPLRPNVPAIGGTQILPPGPLGESKPTNESTFSRSAAERIRNPRVHLEDPADPVDAGLAGLAPAKRRSSFLPIAAAGLVLAGVAAVFLTQNKPASHRPVAQAEPASAAPAAPVGPAVPAPSDEAPKLPASPAKVTIRVVSRPAGAELWLADESAPRGATPLDLVLRRDATEVHGVLKADGYADAKVAIDPGRSGPLEVELEKVKSAPHHHPASHHASHETERVAKPAATPKKPTDGFFGVGD